MEIDEEEDTTDFCEPFFASDPANESASAASEFPQADNFALASTTRLRQDNIGWLFERILHVRFCRHNKDLRLICQDGSVQIDPIFVMPFVHRTSFLAAILKKEEDGSKTIILPDVAIIELHQVMTLLHKVIKSLMRSLFCTIYHIGKKLFC